MTEAAWCNLVVLEARPGRAEFLEQCLTQFTLRCRAEDGCLQYDCFQSLESPGRFLLQIQWRDAGSLTRHLASDLVTQFLAAASLECLGGGPAQGYRDFAPASQPPLPPEGLS